MRLLDTRTGQFVEKDPERTSYTVLSHVWDKVEQSYQEVRGVQSSYDDQGRLHTVSLPADPARRVVRRCLEVGQSLTRLATGPGLKAYHSLRSGIRRLTRRGTRSSRPPTVCHSSSTSSPPVDRPSTPHDMSTSSAVAPIWSDHRLSPKIRESCRVAREAGYRYVWIDSCCIDKTSSSELSESINSMYQWYGRARVCYAFLANVPAGEDPRKPGSAFRSSRWFRRGWTLQELIAPFSVTFLSKDWTEIGTKVALADLVEEITGIPEDALVHAKLLDEYSVAQRLSWAAKRRTTRVEDRAYSLLGIFDINIPTLYGGGERAFRRLQEEIVRRVPDQTLFAWKDVYQGIEIHESSTAGGEKYSLPCQRRGVSLFATSIIFFEGDSKNITIVSPATLHQLGRSDLLSTEYTPTSHGIRTRLPILSLSHVFPQTNIVDPDGLPGAQRYLAILGCEHKDSPGCLLGRVCYVPPSDTGIEVLFPGWVEICPKPSRGDHRPDLFPLSPATIERCRDDIQVKTIYICHPERTTAKSQDAHRQPYNTIILVLTKTTRDALRAQGYTAAFQHPDEDHPNTHWVTLLNNDHMITVEYRHTLKDGGGQLGVEAHVKMLRRALESAEVAFTLAGNELTLKLGLDWAAPSHYFLHIDIVEMEEASSESTLLEREA
ncbi:HET-domain-containing protein [Dichomitus squalens]|uniref:HET-domain-containing protein n=1 Tax=Dichomitus squalens TaxID=114155 RepID=A0A4Q9MV69_9APHY|nr:HET-domain-containing protein [Dichomitus squalens]